MIKLEGWETIAVPEMDVLPQPIFPRSQNLQPRQVFPLHEHRWNQFVYATQGTLVVTVAGAWYVITPEQAIWVPTGVEHTTGSFSGAAFRNLYVADRPDLAMPSQCAVLSVTPLMRDLIVELEHAHLAGEPQSYLETLQALMFEQIKRLPTQDFHLPWPQSPMLQTLCETLYQNPADPRDLEAWGAQLGASARTLSRRFEKEVGISLREWRQKLRLFLALEWLCAGRGITEIALDLGYASTSAFTYMFRQEMGCAPSEWRCGQGRGFCSTL